MTDPSTPSPVLCAGVLVADIFVPPLPSLPAAGELRATEDFLLDTGGCAANVATGLARLGVSSTVCGRIGNDVFGDFIQDDLKAKGVDTSGIRRSSQFGTSKTVVLPVIGEDRRFIHTFGANADFSQADIPSNSLDHKKIIYLGGFLIMPALDTDAVANFFRIARERQVTTILDVVVPVGDASESMQSLTKILPFTDYFLPNDEEARALTGLYDTYCQAQRFRDLGCQTAAITQGNAGTLLMSATEVLEAPVYKVDFVDGSGSGDAFAAGFIAGLLEGWDMAETLRFASAIGASACTRLGCTTGVFTRSEAEDFISRKPLEIRKR